MKRNPIHHLFSALIISLFFLSCSSGTDADLQEQDTADGTATDAAGDVTVRTDTAIDAEDRQPDLAGEIGPDVVVDIPEPDDVRLDDVPPDTPGDLSEDSAPDMAGELTGDVPADGPVPECLEAADCLVISEYPGKCKEYDCIDEECVAVDVADGTECDDEDLCTTGDQCQKGNCEGVPVECDDGDICTEDYCDPVVGVVNTPVPPQACDDGQGNPGTKECIDGAWGECVTTPVCKLKLNSNDSGTVNPFIFPAREGDFYVTFVASEDGGGNMKLLWVDPGACVISNGPFNVNDVAGGVYYWGAQWALSDGLGNFYAVWEAKGSLGDVKFAASETGTDFSPSVEVVSTSENGIDPSLAIMAPGHALVAWSGYNGAQYDPYFSAAPDVFGAGDFSTAVQVSSTPVQVDQTAMAVDQDGNIYVAWETFPDGTDAGGNIYVAKSSDGGVTFGQQVQVNDVTSEANVGVSSFIAWGGGRLYVVWWDTRDDPEGDVYMDSSTDGLDFGADVMINDDTKRYQEDPSVVVGDGTACKGSVYVVWQDFRSNSSYEIWGAKSSDGGASFEPNKQISPKAPEDQMNPAIAVDPSCVVGVVWRDSETNGMFDINATFLPLW